MEIGVVAVLGQLRAKRNWHRIMREWVYADPPATELGEQEWEYFEGRGVKRDPGLAEQVAWTGGAAMSRIKRGWALTKKSWGLLQRAPRADPLPALRRRRDDRCWRSSSSAPASTCSSRRPARPAAIPLLVIGVYVLSVVGFYFSVGLAAAADMIFRGQRGDRRRRARRRPQPLHARSAAGRRSRPRSAW